MRVAVRLGQLLICASAVALPACVREDSRPQRKRIAGVVAMCRSHMCNGWVFGVAVIKLAGFQYERLRAQMMQSLWQVWRTVAGCSGIDVQL